MLLSGPITREKKIQRHLSGFKHSGSSDDPWIDDSIEPE
jgi:hypothetical protein